MKNILFVDVDGTLTGFQNGKQYTPLSAIEALKKSQSKGNINIVCTGRSLFELYSIGPIYEMGFDRIIGANGGYVEYKNHEVYHKILNDQDVHIIRDYLDSIGVGYYLETNEGLFWSPVFQEIFSQKELSSFGKMFKSIELCHYPVNKISLKCTLEQTELIAERFHGIYGTVKTSFGDGHGIEIFNLGVTKFTAIKDLLKYLNTDNCTTYGFGDSKNDQEMFRAVDVKIAMGNSRDHLKELADYITETLIEDGLANAIHHFDLD